MRERLRESVVVVNADNGEVSVDDLLESVDYNGAHRWLSPRAPNLAHMKFNLRWAPAAWARCTARATRGSNGLSR